MAAVAQTPPELKILYIYTERATAKIASDPTIQAFGITNPSQHANTIHNGMRDILENSGLDSSVNSTIAATTVLVPSSGDWKEPISNDVAKMLSDFNDKPETVDIGGSTLDDFMETSEADIVVLVSDTFKLNGAFVNGATVILTNIAGNKANYTLD